MGLVSISVKAPKAEEKGFAKEGSFTYDKPEGLDAAVSAFGAEAVFDGFWSDFVVYLQGVARKLMEAGKDTAFIQDELNKCKPGVKRAGTVDIQAALKTKLAGMSPEDRQAYIRDLLGE